MKKLFTVFFFIFFFSVSGSAQPLYLHWTKFFGGTLDESVRDAIPTRDGSIVFTGLSSSIDGDIPSTPPDTNNSLRYNVMVGKIDSNKQLNWIRIYRGQRMDIGYRVIELMDGGFAVLAYTESSDGDVTAYRGSGDIWLLRLDSAGNLLWQRTFGSSENDQPLSLSETADSSFVILGRSQGSDFDVPFHYGSFQANYDFLLLKVSASGDLIWSKTIGGFNDEGPEGSVFEANGGYYFASASNSKDNDCVDTSWCPGAFTDYDCYLFFLDTAGNIQWGKSYGGSGGDGFRRGFFDERDSSIVLIGTAGSTDYMVTQNYNPQVSALWLVKTDLDGNLIWQKRMGDTASDNLSPSVVPVVSGYIVASGLEEDNQQTYHIGLNDALLHIIDTSGTIVANKLIGGANVDIPVASMMFKQGFAVIGNSRSYVFTEGINDNTNHTSNLQADIFLSGMEDFPLAIKAIESKTDKGLKVYPNPANGLVKVTLPSGELNGRLQITDGNDKVVFMQQLRRNRELEVDTSAWPRGMYFVEWQPKGGERYNTKLIIR